MHECTLYKKLDNKKVFCTACKQACTISPNNTGICAVRQNIDGKLYLLVYGQAVAANIDPIEKKPLFHFLPGTDIFSIGTVGCNFGCEFCQNWQISQVSKEIKARLMENKKMEKLGVEIGKLGFELMPEKIVNICVKDNIPSIAYTYNEPIIFFEYAYDTAKLGKNKKKRNVFVTSGFETDEALEKLKPYLDAMNIDLKSFSDSFYKKVCKARLQPVLDTIKKVHELGIWLEITTLVIPGKNDSDKELKQIADFIASISKDIPWHISAFYPHYKMTDVPATTHDSLIKAYEIGKKAGLNYVYVGNVPDVERSSTYCPKCNELLIERDYYKTTIKNFKNGKCGKCNEKIPGVWS